MGVLLTGSCPCKHVPAIHPSQTAAHLPVPAKASPSDLVLTERLGVASCGKIKIVNIGSVPS